MKIHKIKDKEHYLFFCPGCGHAHQYWCGTEDRVRWTFNNDMEKPTFHPSLRNTYGDGRVCHLFVTDGEIKYCNDCFHDLSGKTIPLPDMDEINV